MVITWSFQQQALTIHRASPCYSSLRAASNGCNLSLNGRREQPS